LTNSGLLELGRRPRRYKYQLLDPIDMPYAAFQFHCRSKGKRLTEMIPSTAERKADALEVEGLAPLRDCSSRISSKSSFVSWSSGNIQLFSSTSNTPLAENARAASLLTDFQAENTAASLSAKVPINSKSEERSPAERLQTTKSLAHIPLNDSDDSLSVKTRDSIEDLSTNVPRSPRSPKSPKSPSGKTSHIPPSPTRSPKSPRRRLTKNLTVTVNGPALDMEKKKRPLSPFTSGGVLRKASLSQSVPATIVESEETCEGKAKAKLHKEPPERDNKGLRTRVEERGGRKLMSFFGRRVTSQKDTKFHANSSREWGEASGCMAGRDHR
jgi:hypothetical protein